MEAIRVERLDHLGLIAAVINDLGLVSLIDARLKPDDQEAITPGEAVKGMILNGLGFANRPLSLSPQFFANKPLDLLFRPDVKAEMLNRFKLGRTLDEVNTYGSDLLFSELALVVCQHEATRMLAEMARKTHKLLSEPQRQCQTAIVGIQTLVAKSAIIHQLI